MEGIILGKGGRRVKGEGGVLLTSSYNHQHLKFDHMYIRL